jgi:hypothetical protein
VALFIENLPEIITPYVDANEPVQIASAPGVGKSESIDQYVAARSEADGFEWGLSKVFIAALSTVDMYGFLVPGETVWIDTEGKKHTSRISEFTVPPWMMSITGKPMNAYRRGIVVFEEWDKGDPDTKKASAEPILNGRLGRHMLHPGISRVVLVNRAEDRSGTTKNFDFIINRRGELNFLATMTGWLKWAMTRHVDPIFTSFAERHAEVVFTNKVPDVQGPFVTPRSLVKCNNVMARRRDDSGEIVVDDVANQIARGYIGTSATAQLMAWLKVKTETPDWNDILRRPEDVEVPERADACLMSCHECAHRVDLKTIRPVIAYMRRMPKEFAMTFAQAAIHRMPKLIVDREMVAWARENRSLLNIIGGGRSTT